MDATKRPDMMFLETLPEEQTRKKAVLNLYQRLSLVQKAVSFIGHEDKRVNGQYSYVGHNAVSAAVRDALVLHGVFSYPHSIESTENGNRLYVKLKMRFVNVDQPEEFIDAESLGFGIDSSDKLGGKAMSYAIKTCLLKVFLIPTGDHSEDIERDQVAYVPETSTEVPAKKNKPWNN